MSLPPKDPEEKVIVTFDFSAVTEGIVTNPSIFVYNTGSQTDNLSMKANQPQVSINKVSFMLQGGTAGNKYDIRCVVDLPSGERVVAKDVLVVKVL